MPLQPDDRYKPKTADYFDFISRGMASYRSTSDKYWTEIERQRTEEIAAVLTTNKDDASKLVTKFTKQTRAIRELTEQSGRLLGAVQHDYVTILSKESHTSVKELNNLSGETKLRVLLLRVEQTKRDINRHIAHALKGTSFNALSSKRTQEITALSEDCDVLIAQMRQFDSLSIEQKIVAFDEHLLEKLVTKVQWSNLTENVLNYDWFWSIPPFDDSSDFQMSLLTLELLCFGMYTHVYAQYYTVQLFSQLTEYFYDAKQLDKYDKYLSDACNGVLFSFMHNNFNKMIEMLRRVSNLQHIQLHHKDVEQFVQTNVHNLVKHMNRLFDYWVKNLVANTFLPSIPNYPESSVSLDFSSSNTATGDAPWIDGSNVSYAVQFVEQKVDETAANAIRSRLSYWTPIYTLRGKANPFVNGVEIDPFNFPIYANGRVVWRRFNGDMETAKIVAFLYENESFRDIDRDLYEASVLGDLPPVQFYLEHGANVSAPFEHRQTALHAAVHNTTTGHLKVALELLKKAVVNVAGHNVEHDSVQSSAVNVQDDQGRTPIYYASESGSTELVRILLEHNANASIASNRRNHQMAPLHIAAYAGHANSVELLMQKVKDLNVRTVEGFTALHFAVAFNRESIVTLLLADNRTEVNAKTYFRCACAEFLKNVDNKIVSILATSSSITPLHMAHAIGSEKMVSLLLEKGADIRMRSSDGSTVMHFAALNNNAELIPDNCSSSLVNRPNAYDLTPLYIAYALRNFEFSKKLIRNCADANIRLTNDRTMLHMAVQSSDSNVAQILLDNRATLDARDSNGITPLEYAVMLGNTTMAELLLDRMENPNAQDSYGDPLVQLVFLTSDKIASQMLNLFIKYNVSIDNAGDSRHKNTLLHLSSAFDCASSVSILLNKTMYHVDAPNAKNETPLHVALRMGCVECANALVDHGNASVTLQGGVANWIALNYAITGKSSSAQTRALAEKFMPITDECHNRANSYQVLAQNVLQAAQYGKFDVNSFYIEHCEFLGTVLQDPIHQNNNPIDLRYLSKLANYGDAHALKILFRLKRNERFGLFDFRQLPVIEALKGSNTSVEVVSFLHDQDFALVPDIALRNYFPSSSNWNALNYTILGKGNRTILELITQKVQFRNRKIEIAFAELRGKGGETLMHLAAQANKVDIAQFLLEKYADLNVLDQEGYSPLHIAARNGNLEMVQFLIENGADAQTTSTTEVQTPIIEAILNNGTVEVVQYLVNKGSAVIENPRQLMLTAAQLNKARIVIFLCEQTDDTSFCMVISSKESKLNVLDYAAMHNNMLLAEYLLNQNNGTDPIDAHAVYYAVENAGQLQMVEYLHSMGASIEDEDESVLALAIVNRKYEVAKFLIDAGADVQSQGKSKRTPLHEAIKADQSDLIQMLVEKGASIICADAQGKTPLDYIFIYKKDAALQYFLFNYPQNDTSLMHLRALKNDFASVQWLVERGGDVNILDSLKNTPLHLAAEKGYIQVARELVQSNCVDISIKNANNQTALNLAEANNQTEIVQLLKHLGHRKRRQIENERMNGPYHNGGTRPSSFLAISAYAIGHVISYAFKKVRVHASRLLAFTFGNVNPSDIPNGQCFSIPKDITDQHDITTRIDLNGTLLLLDVLIRRYYSGERYTMQHSQVKPLEEARACALALVELYQKELNQLLGQDKSFDIDWFEFYRTVESLMISAQYGKIELLFRMTFRKLTNEKINEIELTRMIDRVLIKTNSNSEQNNSETYHFGSSPLLFSNDISHNARIDPNLVHSELVFEVNEIDHNLF